MIKLPCGIDASRIEHFQNQAKNKFMVIINMPGTKSHGVGIPIVISPEAIKECPVDPAMPEEERDDFYEHFDDDFGCDGYDDYDD
jgi:hypothetical protein